MPFTDNEDNVSSRPNNTNCVRRVQNHEYDDEILWVPTIRCNNDEVISLAMRGGSRDEALRAAQVISSATCIALKAA